MKNILHIIDTLWLGWAQTVVKWIFESQKESDTIFLYALRKTEIETQIDHKNVFFYNSKNKYSLFSLISLFLFIKRNKIDVLHCHLAKATYFWILLKIIFWSKVKVIVHEHGEIFEKGKIYPNILNVLDRYVTLYIAVSEATKRKIVQKINCNSEKIVTLYNFVDTEKFKKQENEIVSQNRKKYWLSDRDFIVWFAGRIVALKWWEVFVDSARLLLSEWINIKFVIAWDGSEKDKLLKQIASCSNIHFLWYVDDMVSFYSILDIFVISSYYEAMWITPIEAMSSFIPVIATDIEGLNEVVKDWENWLLFKKWDCSDLKEKIIKMYTDTDIKNSFIQKWLEEVKKYALKKYLVILNDIYERI